MDSALSRLCEIPGNRDLNRAEARFVLDVSMRSLERMTHPNAEGRTLLGCRRIEGGRGRGQHYRRSGRICQIPRVDILIYLARHHTRQEDFLACMKQQAPQYLPAVLAALKSGQETTTQLPQNVILMRGSKAAALPKAETWHPAQLSLFGA